MFRVTEAPVFPGMPRGGKSVEFDGRNFQILIDGEVVEWVDGQPVTVAYCKGVKGGVAYLRKLYTDSRVTLGESLPL